MKNQNQERSFIVLNASHSNFSFSLIQSIGIITSTSGGASNSLVVFLLLRCVYKIKRCFVSSNFDTKIAIDGNKNNSKIYK